jgi:site-specific DNA-methyltransferase (adenine-specific)
MKKAKRTRRASGKQPKPYYDHDGIRIYHGDCLDLLRWIRSESIDMIVTDPPYCCAYRGRDARYAPMANDTGDGWWIVPAYAEMYRVLKPDSFCVTYYGWPEVVLFAQGWTKAGFRPVSHLLFHKERMGLGHITRSVHETAFVLAKGNPKPAHVLPDVLPSPLEKPNGHPTPKPVSVLRRIISAFAPPNACVLDPFLGSGSVLRAAKDLGCCGIGMEIEEKWCELAASRMAQGVLFTPPREKLTQLYLPFPTVHESTSSLPD